ncbi:SnoaL-like domain-containing protein [Parafrankia irregularis]|uniref:SnoaL-like domain-containing protein n=1 Tax=Parafrankia irregularis TaxID=795642 RepID=A0A0S4QL77_9ACTN|nr:nuclear transport factor 2 family protein [Parafrankia irregularis]CUU56189.1 SnoaL-like domain-containing protein [Parafrankia irregularis]
MSESSVEGYEKRIADLEARLRELEDVREINEVFRRWHHACTGGFNGIQAGRMEALEVLTDDATIEIQALHESGKGPKGREEYTKYWDFYFGDAGPLPYVFQTSLDQRIEVHGDTAVQYSNQLGIFQSRGAAPMLSLSRRVNYLRRTDGGWKIYKTTGDSAFATTLADLNGPLNPLPPEEQRVQWTYGGRAEVDPMAPLKNH